MDNKEISRILSNIGIMLEIIGENPFKCRAYYNGARAIESLNTPVETLIVQNAFSGEMVYLRRKNVNGS